MPNIWQRILGWAHDGPAPDYAHDPAWIHHHCGEEEYFRLQADADADEAAQAETGEEYDRDEGEGGQ